MFCREDYERADFEREMEEREFDERLIPGEDYGLPGPNLEDTP